MSEKINTNLGISAEDGAMIFDNRTHFYGRIWNSAALVLILMFPLCCCIAFQVLPEWNALFRGLIAILPMFWAVGTIEFFTFTPMLGSAGTYLAFVTGEMSNLKVPCALNAMEQAGVKADSEHGELLSTIAIAVSSIVSMVIVSVGILLIAVSGFADFLTSEVLQPAFANVLPALFGGLGVIFISKNWRVAIAPILLCLVFFICFPGIAGTVSSAFVPVSALFAIGISRVLYKKGFFGKQGVVTEPEAK